MVKKKCFPSLLLFIAIVVSILSCNGTCGLADEEGPGPAFEEEERGVWGLGPDLVKREERRPVVSTEYGEISAARVTDKINGTYLLQFFTLDPNALFLPVVLHADMVFYVHTGSGRLSWTEEDELKHADLRRGDVHRLRHGTAFFLQSNLETETGRQKLRIHAIFANSNNDLREPATGPYSSIRDMVLGFDRNLLQAAFKAPEEAIGELYNGTKPPAIVHGMAKTRRTVWEAEAQFFQDLVGSRSYNIFELNKKKREGARLFNVFKEDKDFENCNGWSTTVTRKKLSALRGTDISVFIVNLTTGSMMGPHWNPRATEIAVVLQGWGMVRVVCPSFSNQTACRNTSFVVQEGDVFAVPRFHPMAQMSFNNETFVFMGFSTSAKRNHPQFLAGQASVLRTLDRDVLALSFNVTNTTLDQILTQERDSVILGCVSCAEEEYTRMEEEMEKERAEAQRRREEEERRREEERRKEEEEAARRQEEERRRREEEEARKREEEEARRREEEAARKEEEERRHREEEEAARKREEEEAEKRRQEEEAARKQEEERQRQEEEARQREAEEAARREEEQRQREEAERRRQQEEARQREEEEAARRQEEQRQRQEEEARQREAEEAARREEEQRQQQEAERRRQEEAAAARREEEERQRQEEAAAQEERQREEEEAAARREEEERQRRAEEEAAQRRAEEERQEAQRRAEEERQRQEEEERQREEEEARREQQPEEPRERQEEGGGRSEAEEAAEQERRMEEEARREEEAARQRDREQGGGEGRATIISQKRLTI